MTRNVSTTVCLLAAIGVAAPAMAQTWTSKKSPAKTVAVVGCLEAGTRTKSFVLHVLEATADIPAGSRVSLTASDLSEASAHIGQQVEILGTMLRPRRSSGQSSPSSRMYVRDIRQVAPYCGAGARAAAPAPAAAAPFGVTSAPADVTRSTTATAFPSSATATPTYAPSAPVTTQQMAAPAIPAPTTATEPPPVTAVGGPAVTQYMPNTSTQIGTLDQTGVTGDALLGGLLSVNVQQVMAAVQAQANVPVQADVIVNLSNIANDLQVQALVQALNTNPQASMNANDLTSALRSAGLIDPNQFVVGVTGSEIYSNTDLTTKLQQRGIISPSETIMSTVPGRIYVTQ